MKLVKYILMVLAATFIGIFSNPEMLAASDIVSVNGISNLGVVETVVPEPEPVKEIAVATTVTTPAAPKAGVAVAAKATVSQSAPVNNTFNIASAVYSDAIVIKPDGAPIYKTGKLYYGHSYGVMGGIKRLAIGDTVTTEGVSRTVTDIKIYNVVRMEVKGVEMDTLEGNAYLMGKVKNGMGHAATMMTCHGANDSQRYVVFLD